MRIRDMLTGEGVTLTPAEERIAQVLLSDYPTAGLGAANALARRAGVSDPTVTRLCAKLGFEGYQDFQTALKAELEDRLRSPLSMMGSHSTAGSGTPALSYLHSARGALAQLDTATPYPAYDRAVKLIMEARQVWLLGGRFSGHAAGMLAAHLDQFRPGVSWISHLTSQEFDRLVDLGKRDVLLVFDFRRYQSDVISFARQAAAAGARIVLFTDRWQSPISAEATTVLVSPVEVQSPYDTMVPLIAQVEALVAEILARHGDDLQGRIARIEEIRSINAVTDGETS